MGPDEQMLRFLLMQTNPAQGNFIGQAYTGAVNPLPFTNPIIATLGRMGAPVTPLGIMNAQRLAQRAMSPLRPQADLDRDGIVGGLNDFRMALLAGAMGRPLL